MEDFLDTMRMTSLVKEVQAVVEGMDKDKVDEMNSIVEGFNIRCGRTQKEKLENMRDDIGKEFFDQIVAGGSLVPFLDRWVAEKVAEDINAIIGQCVDFFRRNGHEDISEEHIRAYVNLLMNYS